MKGSRSRKKTKIVLDADVIIHFEKAERLSALLDIFPEYEYVVLDEVYKELRGTTRQKIDNFESRLKKISILKFNPTGNSRHDYFALKKTKGAGESACMIYCKENHDVLGSSNLADIHEFCSEHGITCLTTLDFLYYANKRGKMTPQECNECIAEIKSKGSILPENVTDITRYSCLVEV